VCQKIKQIGSSVEDMSSQMQWPWFLGYSVQ